MQKIAVLIPCYNESMTIEKVVKDFKEALQDALKHNRPALLNCHVGEDEKVLPMVAPGAPINDLILE